MADIPSWQFYRFSTIGLSLLDTVDELIREGSLSNDIGNIIMSRYDEAVCSALRKRVDAKCSFTANCSTFNLVDEVYRFTLKNVKFKMEAGEIVAVPSLKVIAVKSGVNDEMMGVQPQPTALVQPKPGKGSKGNKMALEARPLADRMEEDRQQKSKGKAKKK
ncbi:hypothetical protein CPB86DRAFT_779751 [Serendipita vermifera]|nr:hypothetical protein CPB86DRAFT_779751 [Serendipita vermifera]